MKKTIIIFLFVIFLLGVSIPLIINRLDIFKIDDNFDYFTFTINSNNKIKYSTVPTTLSFLDERALYAIEDGIVEKIYVHPGAMIKAGQVLISVKIYNSNRNSNYIGMNDQELKNVHNKLVLNDGKVQKIVQKIDKLQNEGFYSEEEAHRKRLDVVRNIRFEEGTYSLVAPYNGYVVGVNWEEGQAVRGNDLENPGVWLIKTQIAYQAHLEVMDDVIPNVNVGDKVLLKIPSIDNIELEGSVTDINKKVFYDSRNKTRFFKVKALILNKFETPKIPSGLRVLSSLYNQSDKNNLIWIPKSAFDINFPEEKVVKTIDYSEDDKNDVYVGQNDSEKELSEKTSELTKNKNKVLVNNLKLVNHNRIDDFFIINESKEIYNVKVKIVEENLDFIGIKMLPILEGKQVITSYRNQTK